MAIAALEEAWAESDLPATASSFELEEKTIAELQAGMQSGRWTSRSITERYLARIAALNRHGPALHAVIETNPDALALADAMDAERRTKGARGPLHGIPILLKDNIGTHDRMTTTAGSYALEGSIPPRDAYIAQRLREAGAILLGKANLSEWANFRSNRPQNGWSARGGQTRNPYILTDDPLGSSSGSAVAVAANLCAAAVGTETNGSIIAPAFVNGIVGIKPTVGLLSRSMIIPITHNQDTAGPMARTVTDAALLLGAMTGIDPSDPATQGSEGKFHADYTPFLKADGLKGLRIGVVRSMFGDASMRPIMTESLRILKEKGAVLIDPVSINQRSVQWVQIALHDFKADLKAYLEGLGPDAPVQSLKDVIDFNNANKQKEMPFFGQEVFLQAQQKKGLDSPEYQRLIKTYHQYRSEGIDRALRQHRLDCLFSAVTWDASAVAGYPNLTVPAGFVNGRPVAVSFWGGPYSEPTLIQAAYAYEQATKARRPPQFLKRYNTADVNRAQQTLKSTLGEGELSASQKTAMDLDKDGDVDLTDVRLLLKRAFGL